MSLKSRLLNKNSKLKKEEQTLAIPSSTTFDVLNYFENNPHISSVLMYGADKIFVEKDGILKEADIFLKDDQSLVSIIEGIANQYDRIINSQNPSYTIILANGIKITAMMAPLLKEGAFLSLKRQSKCSKNFDGIIDNKIISNEISLFIKGCLAAKLNVFVNSHAQVNKANILNYITNQIPSGESIVTMESFPQLKIKRDSALGMIKHKGSFSKTLRKAINLGHDRIVVSEATINELVAIFEYINFGHSGFLASFSSKSYEEMLTSLQNLIMLSFPNLSEENAASLIYSSIDIIVFVDKTKDGTERITKIAELVKTKSGIKIQDLFVWKESKSKTDKFNGSHYSTGDVSRFFTDSALSGLGFLEEYFNKEYKHNYIESKVSKNSLSLSKTKKNSSSEKLSKYKSLKDKIKKQST